MKYVISYSTKFGSVSVESKDPEDLVTAFPELEKLAQRVSSSNGSRKSSKADVNVEENHNAGTQETAVILRELETNLLSSKFFSQPRTTGETREKLHEVTGKYFTSRKVSQALGILREKSRLKRTGKRNFYTYFATS